MALPLMSLFTMEDSVLIFQLLNYQLTHLPNSRLRQSCLDRKREQNSRNRWHNDLALALQIINYQLWQLPILPPPSFCLKKPSKNQHLSPVTASSHELRIAIAIQ